MKSPISYTLLCLFLFASCSKPFLPPVDVDGNVYDVLELGNRLWMAEDLRVTHDPEGNTIRYYLPNGDTANIPTYGLLYDYENACKVCPKGWRLPTNEEWEALFDFQGVNDASEFKDNSYWEGEANTNSMHFSVRPSGIGNNQEHPNQFQKKVLYWSSDKENDHFIWSYIFELGSDSIRKASQHPTYAFSVRCVKEQ